MAAQDPNNPPDPNSASPIEPGQFVTTGDGGVFKEPPPPQVPNSPAPQTNQPAPSPLPPPMSAPSAPQPGLQFAQSIPPGTTPQPETQPTPTPYVPPQAANQEPSAPSSTISKLKKLLIILGFLLLIVLIGALAWFFVLGKGKLPIGDNKTTQEPSIAPATQTFTPPPVRTTGGFSELPPATGEAEATPSGQ